MWVQFLEKWDTPEYRAKREWAKTNRVSQIGGSLHTVGFMSFATHRRRLEYDNGGKERPFIDVYEKTHRKKKKDGTRGDWFETRAKNTYEEFQKNIEEWRQIQPASEDGTTVQPSPAKLNNMWTTVVGGPEKGRTYGTGDLQSSSSPSLFPSSFSTLQTMKEMEALKKQIVELMRKCAANNAKFAKFDKLEELVKKHMLWSVIASKLSTRTDNDVKNHWNSKLKKKFLAIKANSDNDSKQVFNSSKQEVYSPMKFPFQFSSWDSTDNNSKNMIQNDKMYPRFIEDQSTEGGSMPSSSLDDVGWFESYFPMNSNTDEIMGSNDIIDFPPTFT
ncbi:hypothetical protein FXO38_31615 [Capsicum annuum]|nr:hypothetical protein FXO38_31615 [Capsicum annuum]KAF3683153.1 hypothetical protein FXO37_01998 [Capsicum annuum]